MKNVFKIAILAILIINMFILNPSTNSKYVGDQTINFSAFAETTTAELYDSNGEGSLANGKVGRELLIKDTGYYAIILKGQSGSPDSDLTKNEGGVIACYKWLESGENLYVFLPYLGAYDHGKGSMNENGFGIGMGSHNDNKSLTNIGGAATVLTLNLPDGRENILAIAAGSGAGSKSGAVYRGGGGGSNIKQINPNIDTNFVDKNIKQNFNLGIKHVDIPTPGNVYYGYVSGNEGGLFGRGATELGGDPGYWNHIVAGIVVGTDKGDPGSGLFKNNLGRGGFFGGGGGYAGGGGGAYGTTAGGGGSSFLSDKALTLPQALYEKIINDFKFTVPTKKGTTQVTIERKKKGAIIVLYLGTDEQAIKSFGA